MHPPPGFATVTPRRFVDGAPGFIAFLVDGGAAPRSCATCGRMARSAMPWSAWALPP